MTSANKPILRTPEVESQRFEEMLEVFSSHLAEPHDLQLPKTARPEPTLQVVGAPRSGTTLLTQILAARTDIAYVNNLSAAFWRTPVYGMRLARQLLNADRTHTFNSNYGRTASVSEPHEFGYFWLDLLNHSALDELATTGIPIDWARVQRVIWGMCEEAQRPMMFKSFLLIWHMVDFQRALPNTTFVWVRRSLAEVAVSLLRFREERHGNRTDWVSMKPRSFEQLARLSPVEQVIEQALAIDATIESARAQLSPHSLVEVDYQTLCQGPEVVVSSCRNLLAHHGGELRLTGEPIGAFNERRQAVDDPDYSSVVAALAERGLV